MIGIIGNFGFAELIFLILSFTPILLWIIALVDILKNNFNGNNKIIWVLVVLFLPIFGAILYFIVGRKQKILSV